MQYFLFLSLIHDPNNILKLSGRNKYPLLVINLNILVCIYDFIFITGILKGIKTKCKFRSSFVWKRHQINFIFIMTHKTLPQCGNFWHTTRKNKLTKN